MELIKNTDFSERKPEESLYEQVEFVDCIFSDLSGIDFLDCAFRNCNLSNAKVKNTKLSDITFTDCKLTGVNFAESKDFAFTTHFDNCILDYAIFEKKKLNKSSFSKCKMHSTDFTGADLTKCRLHEADLRDAVFENTNVSGVDFTTSHNFTIDPTVNNVRKAKFLSSDLAGLLTRFNIIVK